MFICPHCQVELVYNNDDSMCASCLHHMLEDMEREEMSRRKAERTPTKGRCHVCDIPVIHATMCMVCAAELASP